VKGVPLEVMQCSVEYAVRVAAGTALNPDPTRDDRGSLVQSKKEKIGPIEEETVYVEGGQVITIRSFPEADNLLREFLKPSGGTYR